MIQCCKSDRKATWNSQILPTSTGPFGQSCDESEFFFFGECVELAVHKGDM